MRGQAIKTECFWLLGCFLLAFLLYGMLVGFWTLWRGTLDIQMHNTYFVVSHLHAVVLLFWVLTLVVTSARAIAAPLRTRYTWVVLLVFGLVLLLLVGIAALVANKVLR